MCRIRFHRDGIYLSILFIEKLEEPYCPLEKVYHKRSYSPLPRAATKKNLDGIDLSKKVHWEAKEKKSKPSKAIENSQESKTASSLSLTSSSNGAYEVPGHDSQSSSLSSSSSSSCSSSSSPPRAPPSEDGDQEDRLENKDEVLSIHSEPISRKRNGSTKPEKSKSAGRTAKEFSKPKIVTPSPIGKGNQRASDDSEVSKQSSSSKKVRFFDNPLPPKQVRIFEMVEKDGVPGEDNSENSSSSDSSRESNVDAEAHILLQSKIGSSKPKPLQASSSMGSSSESLDKSVGYMPSNVESGKFGNTESLRFQRQRMLSPLSTIHRPSLKRLRKVLHDPTVIIQSRIEDSEETGFEEAPDLRRIKEGRGGLRKQFIKEGHVLKSAMKKGKENNNPVHISEENVDNEIEVDAKTGITWRDV